MNETENMNENFMQLSLMNSLSNFQKFESYMNKRSEEYSGSVETRTNQFHLWINDVKTKVTSAIESRSPVITFNFFAKGTSQAPDLAAMPRGLSLFTDLQSNYIHTEGHGIEDFDKKLEEYLKHDKREAKKRRKNLSLDEGGKKARHLNSVVRGPNKGEVREEENTEEYYSPKMLVEEDDLNMNNNLNIHFSNNNPNSQKSNKPPMTLIKRFQEEDVIEEMPSKEEEMKFSIHENSFNLTKKKFSTEAEVGELQLDKIDYLISEIKKTSIADGNAVDVIDFQNESKISQTSDSNHNENSLKPINMTEIIQNLNESDFKVEEVKKEENQSLHPLGKDIQNTPDLQTDNNPNNKINFLSVQKLPSNNPQIQSDLAFTFSKKEVSKPATVTNSNNTKFKSNALSNKELLKQIFNNEDSVSNGEDSPPVEKWVPSSNIDIKNTKTSTFNNTTATTAFNFKWNNTSSMNPLPSQVKSTQKQATNNNCNNDLQSNQKNNILSSSKPQSNSKTGGIYLHNTNSKPNNKSNNINSKSKQNTHFNLNLQMITNADYEITDKSGSSSDDCSEEFDLLGKKKRKYIPQWAENRDYLSKRVIQQRTLNYRSIFGTCRIDNLDLNIIFSNEKAKYNQPRGDSADWHLDVTHSSIQHKTSPKENEEGNNRASRALDFSDISVISDN